MSNEIKHTPGPWWAEWDERAVPGAFSINSFRDGHTVYIAETFGGLVEEEANARLIAAAPDLLGALEEVVGFVEAAGWTVSKARAAIAKAKGKGKEKK